MLAARHRTQRSSICVRQHLPPVRSLVHLRGLVEHARLPQLPRLRIHQQEDILAVLWQAMGPHRQGLHRLLPITISADTHCVVGVRADAAGDDDVRLSGDVDAGDRRT